jgi:glycosyltransferase involved in cell wall biosynthesis
MRITIVMGFFLPMPPAAGGATEKSWDQLAHEFARRGHEVTILSRTWKGWPDRENRDGVTYLRLPGYRHTRSLARNLWRDFRWSLRVWRALPPADLTVVNSIALPVWLGWLRRHSGRLVVMPGRVPKGQYRLYRKVDRVLAVSSPVRNAVLRENPGFAPITRISGYPIHWRQLAEPPRPEPTAGAPVTLGFIGRIHEEKGLHLLAAALAELARQPDLPAWRVVLCGPHDVERGGSGEGYLRQLRSTLESSLPPGRFEFRPAKFAPEQLAAVYREIDIFCYPSLAVHGETFGVAVAEAMAAGAVPVVSALPCFLDFVRPGENGASFDQGAPDAANRLAAQLAGLLREPPVRRRLAEAARATVQRYDFPLFAERLLEDFSTLK